MSERNINQMTVGEFLELINFLNTRLSEREVELYTLGDLVEFLDDDEYLEACGEDDYDSRY